MDMDMPFLNDQVRNSIISKNLKDDRKHSDLNDSSALFYKELRKTRLGTPSLFKLKQVDASQSSNKRHSMAELSFSSSHNKDDFTQLLKDYKEKFRGRKPQPNFQIYEPPSIIEDTFFGNYYVGDVPQEKDLQTLKGVGAEYEGSEMFSMSEYSLGPDGHERHQESHAPKSDLESFAYSSKSESSTSLSAYKLQERESTQTRDTWGELSYGEQVKLLRIGPSCPELLEKTRHIIETKEVETNDPPLESSHLDYALIMNMLEGNWGVDEDQNIAQITFKYIHDESFRKRLAKECHSIIDECECPAHQTITSEKLMNMDDSCYYDIETEEDKIQVIDKLRKEFKEKYEDEMNMDLERMLNPGPDSDEDDDYYDEVKKNESKEEETEDWLNATKDVDYKTKCPKYRSEEALLNRIGYPERPEKIRIRRLKMKDFVKSKEKKNIEEVVQTAYNLKVNQFRIDDFKEVKWRPKKTYVYRKPDWTKLDPKHDSFIDEENIEDVKYF